MTLVPISESVELRSSPAEPITLQGELALWQECFEFAKAIATTPFVPASIRNNPAAVMATILRGHELGVSAMHSLQQIDFIDGRPALRAELMRALVQRHGHELWTEEHSVTRVTLCGRRAGQDHVQKVTWTLDDAKRAGLSGKQNWQRYPRAMLMARCSGELGRLQFADVLAGMSYATEELEDLVDELDAGGEGPGELAAAPVGQVRKAANPTAKTRGRKARPKPAPLAQGDLPALPVEEAAADAPGEAGEAGEPEELVLSRAQGIAMRAQQEGVDHHLVIAAVTNGLKSSAKSVSAEEASQVYDALMRIRQRKLWLDVSTDPPRLVSEPPSELPAGAPPASESEPGFPEVAGDWSADQWGSYLAAHKCKVTELLAEAQRLARMDGEDAPQSLQALAGRDGLCELLVSFVLGRGE